MKLTIWAKLFFGFLVIICLNVTSEIAVSMLSNLTSIANSLKIQNDIKNILLQIGTLHTSQERRRFLFTTIQKDNSVERFIKDGESITKKIQAINAKLENIVNPPPEFFGKDSSSIIQFDSFKLIMKHEIEIPHTMYTDIFNEYVNIKQSSPPTTKTIPELKIKELQLDTSDMQLKDGLFRAQSFIDMQNEIRIDYIRKRIDYVKNTTQIIVIVVALFSLGFALIISRNISNNLRRLKESAKIIAKGDYTFNSEGYPNDEIGELANAFFEMACDLKKAEDELTKKRRLAAIGEIVASINHEINNPLMIISGNAQVLEMTIDRGVTKDIKERIKTILQETERISQVTKKLRDIKNPVVEDYTSTGERMINLDKSSS